MHSHPKLKDFFSSIVLGGALFLLSCSQELKSLPKSPDPYGLPEKISLAELFHEKNPLSYYLRYYGAFRLVSEAQITRLGTDENPEAVKISRTELLHDENGQYVLKKIPFSKDQTVDLVYLNREFFLRYGRAKKFQKVRQQTEFDTWVSATVKELLTFAKEAGLGEGTEPFVNDKLECFRKDLQSLCIDPTSGLPLSGQIEKPLSNERLLRLSFEISPQSPNQVKVEVPIIPENPEKATDGEKE